MINELQCTTCLVTWYYMTSKFSVLFSVIYWNIKHITKMLKYVFQNKIIYYNIFIIISFYVCQNDQHHFSERVLFKCKHTIKQISKLLIFRVYIVVQNIFVEPNLIKFVCWIFLHIFNRDRTQNVVRCLCIIGWK